MSEPPLILVDADACPVKEEIYKVAFRHGAAVKIVSNAHLRVPATPHRAGGGRLGLRRRRRLDRGTARARTRWWSPATSCSPTAASRPERR
jgi:hypothetical protein